MKNIILMFAVLAGVVGCSDNVPTNCVVKEAIVRNGPLITGKVVFTHDGTNYTEARSYLFDPITSKYELQPVSVFEYSYYDDGRVAKVKSYANSADTFDQHEYSYSDAHITTVADRYKFARRNVVRFDSTYQFHYIKAPQDCTYHFGNQIEEYKNGNLVRLGTASSFLTYKYDNFPNVIGGFAFHNLVPTRNFGYTRNNIVEEQFSGSSTYSRKQSFAYYGNGQLNQWIYYDTNRVISFVYECR